MHGRGNVPLRDDPLILKVMLAPFPEDGSAVELVLTPMNAPVLKVTVFPELIVNVILSTEFAYKSAPPNVSVRF